MKSIIKSILNNFTSENKEHKEVDTIQSTIHYRFKNVELLLAAITHTSLTTPNTEPTAFERMEFLGDSILGLIISEALFMKYPDFSEGELSKLKAKIVSKKFLKLKAKELNLGDSLILSSEAINSGGRDSTSILGDAMESLICAVYLDGGIASARKFILNYIFANFEDSLLHDHLKDFKSKLQEYSQAEMQVVPQYKIIAEEGPDHDKEFTAEVYIQDKCFGTGKGPNKKSAQQDAARVAIRALSFKKK